MVIQKSRVREVSREYGARRGTTTAHPSGISGGESAAPQSPCGGCADTGRRPAARPVPSRPAGSTPGRGRTTPDRRTHRRRPGDRRRSAGSTTALPAPARGGSSSRASKLRGFWRSTRSTRPCTISTCGAPCRFFRASRLVPGAPSTDSTDPVTPTASASGAVNSPAPAYRSATTAPGSRKPPSCRKSGDGARRACPGASRWICQKPVARDPVLVAGRGLLDPGAARATAATSPLSGSKLATETSSGKLGRGWR